MTIFKLKASNDEVKTRFYFESHLLLHNKRSHIPCFDSSDWSTWEYRVIVTNKKKTD